MRRPDLDFSVMIDSRNAHYVAYKKSLTVGHYLVEAHEIPAARRTCLLYERWGDVRFSTFVADCPITYLFAAYWNDHGGRRRDFAAAWVFTSKERIDDVTAPGYIAPYPGAGPGIWYASPVSLYSYGSGGVCFGTAINVARLDPVEAFLNSAYEAPFGPGTEGGSFDFDRYWFDTDYRIGSMHDAMLSHIGYNVR